jgi:HEAT repeat protein
MPRRTFACIALASLFASACVTTDDHRHPASNSRWLEPSSTLRAKLDDEIARLPWTHGIERVEQIQWLAGVGEPAYDALLELCEDPRPDVAASAVAALGATGDSRLVEPLHAVEWTAPSDRALEFEQARAFARLGDWSRVDVLIGGLEDDTMWARAWSIQALREVTGQDLGFDPKGDAQQRAASVVKWRAWLASRTGEGILARRTQ